MDKSDRNPVYREVPWLKPSDRPLLLEFSRYGAGKWVEPSTITLNVHWSGNHVARRCRELHKHRLLEKHPDARAAYRLTDLGVRFLDDQVTAQELRDVEPRDDEAE